MGRRRKGRAVHGIVVLDKPSGLTSNGALQRVKRLYDAQKAGHTGSLDPMATGLLPICLGEATKISGFLLDADKTYRFTCRLGERTDSGDADGEMLEQRPVEEMDETAIERALMPLRGEILQVPPMHSAIKRGGQPLYRLAHRGQSIEREPRRTVIHRLEMLAFDGRDVTLETDCAKGTYVRALADDLGAALGCGAHVIALRRLSAGPFREPDMIPLQRLEAAAEEDPAALDALLLPPDTALADWPGVTLNADLAHFLRQGQAVQVPRAPTSGMLRLYASGGTFLGIGRVQDDGRVAPGRLMNL